MRLNWEPKAWSEYVAWQTEDKKTLKRINNLIKEILRDPETLEGLGKPEVLKYDLAGCMSREIDEANRIVYTVLNDHVLILRCKGHYR